MRRPEVRNALDRRLIADLRSAFGEGAARAVILGSSDPVCFSAGVDLSLSDAERARASDELYDLYEVISSLSCPVVAAVSGPAIGGGAQLAVACDLRVGGPSTSFKFAGVGHGLAVGSWALPSLVGRGRALDLCLTMRSIECDEAVRIGLLDRVDTDPVRCATGLASSMAGAEPEAVIRAKEIVRSAYPLLPALRHEREGNAARWDGSTAGLRTGARPAERR
jgi:enoyl-CoA hydratase/carnithine racemase